MGATTELGGWLATRREHSGLHVERIELTDCAEWDLVDGELRHRSGRYFQITGLRVTAGPLAGWQRPIIRQSEVGILGFLTRTTARGTEWLVQAKTEPGNANGTQAGPTVQATESNYERVHGGSATAYLEWFTADDHPGTTRSDVLASEHGARFLGKRNRNVVVATPGEGPAPRDARWRWFPSRDLRAALSSDLAVNTDARSVIATGPWALLSDERAPFGSEGGDGFRSRLARSYAVVGGADEVARELEARRATARVATEEVAVTALEGWRLTDWGLEPDTAEDVAVEYVAVAAADREVAHWCQPLLTAARPARCDLWCRERGGVLHVLFRFVTEPGLSNVVELGASWQSDAWPSATALPTELGATRLSVLQSDEGGRFSNSVCRYHVIELDGDVRTPEDGLWLTLGDIEALARQPGTFTNEARSAISLLLSLA